LGEQTLLALALREDKRREEPELVEVAVVAQQAADIDRMHHTGVGFQE
jgi:hypothetical protein